ncbi:MAG: hypothetical protein ACOYL6_08310 [Bacteriovoracaceae bacterium]
MKPLILIILIPLLFSCAKSNYVSTEDLKRQFDEINSDCSLKFQNDELCLSMEWEIFPTEDTFGRFVMKFYKIDHPEITIEPNNAPNVLLWMPSMGHGSSPVTLTTLSPGTYLVSDVFFNMLGTWDIRFQLKNGNDVIEQQILKITI